MMNFFFNRLNELPIGEKRKYILYSLLIPLGSIVIHYFLKSFRGRFISKMLDFLEVVTIFGFFIFWIGLRLILWVKDGYDKKN